MKNQPESNEEYAMGTALSVIASLIALTLGIRKICRALQIIVRSGRS